MLWRQVEVLRRTGLRTVTEQEIFEQAIDKAYEERAAFLDEACARNTDLRRGVEILLWLHADTHRFLEESGLEQRGAVHAKPESAATVGRLVPSLPQDSAERQLRASRDDWIRAAHTAK